MTINKNLRPILQMPTVMNSPTRQIDFRRNRNLAAFPIHPLVNAYYLVTMYRDFQDMENNERLYGSFKDIDLKDSSKSLSPEILSERSAARMLKSIASGEIDLERVYEKTNEMWAEIYKIYLPDTQGMNKDLFDLGMKQAAEILVEFVTIWEDKWKSPKL